MCSVLIFLALALVESGCGNTPTLGPSANLKTVTLWKNGIPGTWGGQIVAVSAWESVSPPACGTVSIVAITDPINGDSQCLQILQGACSTTQGLTFSVSNPVDMRGYSNGHLQFDVEEIGNPIALGGVADIALVDTITNASRGSSGIGGTFGGNATFSHFEARTFYNFQNDSNSFNGHTNQISIFYTLSMNPGSSFIIDDLEWTPN
jgi:hypothetical protein